MQNVYKTKQNVHNDDSVDDLDDSDDEENADDKDDDDDGGDDDDDDVKHMSVLGPSRWATVIPTRLP